MKARIIRYDARHSYHAPAALLADFAVFDIHSRSGVRLKDGTASPAQSPRCRVHQQISGRRDHDLRRRPENVPTVTIWLEHHRHRTIRPADGVYVVLRAGHTKPRPRCRRSGRPRAAVARLTGPGVRHRSHPSAVACTAPGHRRVLSGKAVLVAGRALAVAVTLEPRPANEAAGTHDAVGGGDLARGTGGGSGWRPGDRLGALPVSPRGSVAWTSRTQPPDRPGPRVRSPKVPAVAVEDPPPRPAASYGEPPHLQGRSQDTRPDVRPDRGTASLARLAKRIALRRLDYRSPSGSGPSPTALSCATAASAAPPCCKTICGSVERKTICGSVERQPDLATCPKPLCPASGAASTRCSRLLHDWMGVRSRRGLNIVAAAHTRGLSAPPVQSPGSRAPGRHLLLPRRSGWCADCRALHGCREFEPHRSRVRAPRLALPRDPLGG